MKALFLSVLILSSCTKYSKITKDAMGLRVTDVIMKIHNLKEVEWAIGLNKEAIVTQSIVFTVDMPKLDEDDLAHLTELKGVDSWIIRLIAQRGSEKQDLGSLYARFKPKKILRGQFGGAPSNVTLKIYYAAAYPSERFRTFPCPAFSHTRRITDMKVQGEPTPFDLVFEQKVPYPEKVHLIELSPSAFNGGNSLAGEYFVEIAPYDSDKKVIHAGFKRIPMSVQVVLENNQAVESCLGVHPEMSN